jgi:chromosome segregation ATPase
MQEIVDGLQADVDRLKVEAQSTKSQSCDSEKMAADATAQLVKLQQDLAKAEDDAKLTKLRQQDLENEIAQSKVALQSAETEKLQLELDLESKVELEVLKKRLDELYKEREVQEVEAAKLAKEKEAHTKWISGLSRHLEIQSALATKANEDKNRLEERLAETEAEMEKVKKQLKATKDTMKWLTSVEKAVKSTAVHIDDCMDLNHKKGFNNLSGKRCTCMH